MLLRCARTKSSSIIVVGFPGVNRQTTHHGDRATAGGSISTALSMVASFSFQICELFHTALRSSPRWPQTQSSGLADVGRLHQPDSGGRDASHSGVRRIMELG